MAVLPRLSVDTLGRKIALAIGLPIGVALATALGLSYGRAQGLFQQNAIEEASVLANVVTTSFSLLDAQTTPPAPPAVAHGAVAASFRAKADVQVLRVVDRDGVVRWSHRAEEVGTRVPDHGRLLSAPPEGIADAASGEYVRPLGGASCAACHARTGALGAVQVIVSHPRVQADLAAFFRTILLILAVGLGLLATASGILLHLFITRRLSRLTRVMQNAKKGEFLARAKVEGSDEISRLAEAFNAMVSHITEMKVAEIETSREIELMQRELALKAELERQHKVIEEKNRALARRVREGTLLLDITRSLNSTLALPEILSRVTEKVGVTMGVDQFTVMLLDRGNLEVAASFGYQHEKLAGFRLPIGQGTPGRAAKTREPVYLDDLRANPLHARSPQEPTGDASLLCVPMVCRDELVGVLSFVRLATAAFSPEDLVFFQLVGSQAAMAIVNARIYSETLELSVTDPLTGVFNRRKLGTQIETEIGRALRTRGTFALAMVDIDHFKHLNDTRGHPAGDGVLREVAGILRRTVRPVDTVARYGGEEFMIVLPKVDRSSARDLAEALRRAVERAELEYGDQQPGGKITISIGVAIFPADGQTLERLVDAVDSALYAAKEAGRNAAMVYELGMEMNPGRQRGPLAELQDNGPTGVPAKRAS